jgi:hypothetical protein
VLSQAALQRRAGDRFIGRLAAIDELSVAVAMCATAALSAAFVPHVGGVAGPTIVFVACGVGAWIVLMRSSKCPEDFEPSPAAMLR